MKQDINMTTEIALAPPMRSLNEGQLKRLYFDFVAYRDSNGGSIGIVAWHRDEDKEMVLTEGHADTAINAAMEKQP